MGVVPTRPAGAVQTRPVLARPVGAVPPPPGGNAGQECEGDRRQCDGVELGTQLDDAFAGLGERGDEALVLRGQAHRLGAGLAQLVTGEVA